MRAVDRVHVPARRVRADRGAVLLADDVMVREPLGDASTKGRLDQTVDLGHEGAVSLRLDRQLLAQPLQRELIRDVGA